MVFGKHGLDCPCCKGPAAWSTLVPSLAPLAPTASIESHTLSANNQPEVAKRSFIRDWLRLPSWALPTRPSPHVPVDDDALIPLDAILAGRTRSPIRVEDLRAFLRSEEQETPVSLRALEFLLTYNSYRAAFFALPAEKQSPHPLVALERLAVANYAAELQIKLANKPQPPLPTSTPEPAPPQPAVTIQPTVSISYTDPQLDPDYQPLRHQMQNIIDLYLQPHSLSPITSLVSSNKLSQALSEAKITTHPSALDRVASNVHSYLTTSVLPRFLDHAVSNLSATTSRGRMLIAGIAFAAAIVLEVFMIMYRTNRAARLLALPLWILAIGYAIGSRTGLCFWLAWRGTREQKTYEGSHFSSSSSGSAASFRTSVASSHPQRPRPLLLRINPFARKSTTDDGEFPSRPGSMAEKGELPEDIAAGAADDDQKSTSKLRRSQSGEYTPTSSMGGGFEPLTTSKTGLLKQMMRLTGTAVDTVHVEDSRVRKLQAMVGLRVAIWLFLSTSLVIGVLMAIP
ncbi:hypothetical protein BDV93DRAFT_604309 [Ceratobasidium sp. AG-I]|nr:hypothetical protein BDV93DRAFT_604309 [Ceratobasidium sp. AG-I]